MYTLCNACALFWKPEMISAREIHELLGPTQHSLCRCTKMHLDLKLRVRMARRRPAHFSCLARSPGKAGEGSVNGVHEWVIK